VQVGRRRGAAARASATFAGALATAGRARNKKRGYQRRCPFLRQWNALTFLPGTHLIFFADN